MLEQVVTVTPDTTGAHLRALLAADPTARVVVVRQVRTDGTRWFAIHAGELLDRLHDRDADETFVGDLLDLRASDVIATHAVDGPPPEEGLVVDGARAVGWIGRPPTGATHAAARARRSLDESPPPTVPPPAPAVPTAPTSAPRTVPPPIGTSPPGSRPPKGRVPRTVTEHAPPPDPASPPDRSAAAEHAPPAFALPPPPVVRAHPGRAHPPPPAPAPRDVPPPPVHARVDAPDEVSSGATFVVTIGLVHERPVGVTSAPLALRTDPRDPVAPVMVRVQVVGDGFTFPDGIGRTLRVDPTDVDASTTTVTVVAPERDTVHWGVLQVEYAQDGQPIGRAWRQVLVVPDPDDVPSHPAPAAGQTPLALATDPRTDVDLTISLVAGDAPGTLLWRVHSPHDVELPDEQLTTTLPLGDARAFALQQVRTAADHAGPLAASWLDGVARTVAQQVPPPVWRTLTAVWRRVHDTRGGPPTVLLVSCESSVPWELASCGADFVLDRDLVDGDAPTVLGAQLRLGRWSPPGPETPAGRDHPHLPPDTRLHLGTLALVVGDYALTSGLRALPEASAEGDHLAALHPDHVRLAATADDLADLLGERLTGPNGDAVAVDAVHVACHGEVDPSNPRFNGIVLADGTARLDELTVRGGTLGRTRRPLVFLNACQLGTASADLLGDHGGLAAAFLATGCRAFVAPLWSVDDTRARTFAEDFYRLVLVEGLEVGEAMRRCRAAWLADPTDPTPLAYLFHGHPRLQVSVDPVSVDPVSVAPAAPAPTDAPDPTDPSGDPEPVDPTGPVEGNDDRVVRAGRPSSSDVAPVPVRPAPTRRDLPGTARTLHGGDGAVDLGQGVRVTAPGVRGRATVVAFGAAAATRAADVDGGSDAFHAALATAGLVPVRAIAFDVTAVAPRAGDDPALRTSGGEDGMVVEVPDLGPDVAQVLLSVDETGVATWSFPVDAGGQVAPAHRGAGGSVRFVVRADHPDPAAGGAHRGLLGVIGRKVVQVLAHRALEGSVGWAAPRLAAWFEERRSTVRVRTFLPGEHALGTATVLDDAGWRRLAAGPSLWFVHGTFSTAHGGFGGLDEATLRALHTAYDGRVVAFDHHTVSVPPAANVTQLRELVPDGLALTVDVVAHSRGGLVARALAGEGLPAGTSSPLVVRRAVHVAAPNHGTALADPARVGAYLDRVTTLLNLVPDGIGTVADTLAGILDVVKVVATAGLASLPGLAAMDPRGSSLTALNAAGTDTDTALHAVAADFEPTGPVHRLVTRRVQDVVVDGVFGHAGNDVVVPTDGVWRGSAGPLFPVPPDRRLVLGREAGVTHSDYFRHPDVRAALLRWLG